MSDPTSPTATRVGDDESAFVGGLPIVGDVIEGLGKVGELARRAVKLSVFNRTNSVLTLLGTSEGDDDQGRFTTFPGPDIAPGEETEIEFVKEFEVIRFWETLDDCEGFVDYQVGDTGRTWRLFWENPVDPRRDPSLTLTLEPDSGPFTELKQVGEGATAAMTATFREPGFTPGGSGIGTTSRCIVTVVNDTLEVLDLVDQGHERGGFFTQPQAQLQPGETDSFGSVETQGVTDPRLQGSKGFLRYRVPSGGDFVLGWDNPERAQNTSTATVEGAPAGSDLAVLDQIGEGEDNVPVTFVLSGGGGGGVTDEVEWVPPVEVEQPTLRFGDEHPDGWVEYLQELLNFRANAGLVVDGDYGAATNAAVLRFQRDLDIQEDGVVGNQTWAALRGEVPVPASTDGLPPNSFVEGGPEARWAGELGIGSGYDPATDTITLACASVGDSPIDGFVATIRITGNDSGEVFLVEAPLGPPILVHERGGADHHVQLSDLRAAFGPGVHTVEAYLPAELGGDYQTFQIRIE